ncbi:MAG: hypothetical protein WAU07_05265 [Microgenomates group bacterium]
MKIFKPTLQTNDAVSRVECAIEYRGKKHLLWIEFDSKYKPFVALDATAVTSPFIMPASRRNEDVEILDRVSQKWLKGVNAIVDRAVSWNHGFKKIAVHSLHTNQDQEPKFNHVGAFFSGGIDSFSTLIKYTNDKNTPLSHLFFVHGYDIEVGNDKLIEEVRLRMREIAQKSDLELVEFKTNVREITDTLLGWEMAHGGALAMVALLLRRGFKTVIIPGGGANNWPEPWGSSQHLDPLWGTETLEIIHDMDHMHRYDKVREHIAKSPLALAHARVCWRNTAYNCGRCDKCMLTMVELRIAGALEQCSTFPEKLNLERLSKMYSTPFSVRMQVEEAAEHLQKTGNDPELLAALESSLEYSDHPGIIKKTISIAQQLDWKYNESRLFVFLHKRWRWS